MPRGAHLTPAPVGNQLATTHGCYSVLRLRGRAETIRAEIEPLLPMASPADGPMIDTLAILLAQLERSYAILAATQVEEGEAVADGRRVSPRLRSDLSRLAADARGWANSAARLADQLGLTPTSRARLGLDVVRARSAKEELDDYLAARAARDG